MQSVMNKQQRAQRRPIPSQSDPILVCLNPKCTAPSNRCLDSRSLRSHPSDCSRHYFPVDTITSIPWGQIPDYPSDPLGMAVMKCIRHTTAPNKSRSVFRGMVEQFKERVDMQVELFCKKFEQVMPTSALEDSYVATYALESIAKYLSDRNSPEFITNIINSKFDKAKYGELESIYQKVQSIGEAFDSIVSGFKNQLKTILQKVGARSSTQADNLRYEDGRLRPKIQCGLLKSKFIASNKIEYKDGLISFPKLENIASFMPWIYSDGGFVSGTHQLRIVSLKFPYHPNAGLTVLEQHDIDTYPYQYFKSLFSADGKGFRLLTPSTSNEQIGDCSDIPAGKEGSEIEHTIGQISEISLRLELDHKPTPRAMIRDADNTSMYVCRLAAGRKYRLGLYGCGWAIQVKQLY